MYLLQLINIGNKITSIVKYIIRSDFMILGIGTDIIKLKELKVQ